MTDKTTHIRITLVVDDEKECPGAMQGFAEVARLPASEEARIRGMETTERTRWLADFWNERAHYDDVSLTDEAVSELLGKPAAELVSLGRQRLAQINDEAASWLVKRHPFLTASPAA